MRKQLFFVCCACLIVGLNSRADEIVPHYKITDLSSQLKTKPAYISAEGINDKGEVVGRADGRAYVWCEGKMSFLGKLPDSNSCGASDINNAGQIVGTCSFGEWDKKYFLWQNGKMQNLGAAPFLIEKILINESGEVLINLQTRQATQATLWRAGRQKSIGGFWPWALNDKGEVAGLQMLPVARVAKRKAETTTGEMTGASAVVWQDGIAVSAGKDGSMAVLLNNRHDVVLWEEDYSVSPAMRRSFLVQGSKKTLLGEFDISGQDRNIVAEMAMNEKGQIVAYGLRAKGAFVWQGEAWHDLNALIPANSAWALEKAMDINENGQIIGEGAYNGKSRAFLLTPISNP